MALYVLTADGVLADYVMQELDACVGHINTLDLLPPGDMLIVDADLVPPPYPAFVCLVIARTKQKTDVPCLLRPLAPGTLAAVLAPTLAEDELRLVPVLRAGRAVRGTLLRKDALVSLSCMEYLLCEALLPTVAGHPPLSRVSLCRSLADSHAEKKDDMLTVYMYRLRKKLSLLRVTLVNHREDGYSLRKEC